MTYYRSNWRHVENCSYHWDSTEEVNCHGEEATEEDHEPVEFNTHANDGPSQQDNENTTKECPTTLGLVPLKEESECSFQANNACQARQK